jgi:MoaA/NifB/PqqE/SkfB family radical SAM enzyme
MRFSLDFLSRQALNHFRQKVVRADGATPARPVNFNITPTFRCNCRCVMCRLSQRGDRDLDCAELERALGAIREWLGTPFFVNVSGGEPLMYADLYRLISFCRRNSIYPKIGTNGFLLTPETCDRLAAAGLEYLSVSVDSLRPEVQDSLRGVPGALDKALSGLGHLRERGIKAGVNTVISSRNASELESLAVSLFEEHKIARLNFQPVEPTLGTDVGIEEFRKGPLWVSDLAGLSSSLRGLVGIRKRYAILNSAEELWAYYRYFEGPETRSPWRTCAVGTTNYFIGSRGEVRLCWKLEPIGEIGEPNFDPARMWNSSLARAVRLRSVRCRTSCTAMCYRSPSLAQKVKYLFFLR